MWFYHQPNSFIHKPPTPNQIISDTMEVAKLTRYMSTYFGRTVRFVAGAAEVCSHTVLFAIQNGFDGIVDTAEVGSFYLSHMTRLAYREVYDIFQSITPFVCNYFCVDAFFVH